MEPINFSRTLGNLLREIPANFSTGKVVTEKSSSFQKNLSEKKCVHRTETGFCKRSNRQCPLFNL